MPTQLHVTFHRGELDPSPQRHSGQNVHLETFTQSCPQWSLLCLTVQPTLIQTECPAAFPTLQNGQFHDGHLTNSICLKGWANIDHYLYSQWLPGKRSSSFPAVAVAVQGPSISLRTNVPTTLNRCRYELHMSASCCFSCLQSTYDSQLNIPDMKCRQSGHIFQPKNKKCKQR